MNGQRIRRARRPQEGHPHRAGIPRRSGIQNPARGGKAHDEDRAMTEQNDTHYERTLYEAQLDIDYSIELHSRHVQFFKHLDGLFTFLTLLGSSSIIFTLAKTYSIAASGAAGLIVLITLLDITIKPAKQAAHHADMKRRWAELRRRSQAAELNAVDAELHDLNALDTHVIRPLEMVAFNANLARHGRDEAQGSTGLTGWLWRWVS